jgi:FkbM family methyltransferase
MNNFVKKALRGRKVLLGRDFYQSRQVKCARLTLGNRFAEWTVCPDHLDENSVIYSFGVGEDISFDLELMEQFRLHIHAFDPSPRSIEWIQLQNLREEFHFHPFGIAGSDGPRMFSEPDEPGIHSLKMIRAREGKENGGSALELPVKRLSTIMQELRHDRIDILKMDVEGTEYEVIEDLIGSSIPVSQVLIEFHHRFDHIGTGMTRQAIASLNGAGYRIFHVSASGEEFSFIKIHA